MQAEPSLRTPQVAEVDELRDLYALPPPAVRLLHGWWIGGVIFLSLLGVRVHAAAAMFRRG